jgi:hypothetical protein
LNSIRYLVSGFVVVVEAEVVVEELRRFVAAGHCREK